MTKKPLSPESDDTADMESVWTILVADDDEGLNRLICRALKGAGYKTISAFSGKDAISLAGDHVNLILLLDLKLPDMNGEEVIGKLSQFQNPIPFAVLTGQGDEKIAVQMMKLGARDYLTKDLNILEMLPGILERITGDLEKERRLKQAEEDLIKANVRLEAFRKIATLNEADLETIYKKILASIIEMTGSPLGFFGFINEDETVMTIHSWSGEAMKECQMADKPVEFPIAEAGLLGEAVRQRRFFILNDYSAAHSAKKGLPAGHVPLSKLMVIPVFSSGKIVSVSAVANRAADYTREDAVQIQSFSENMWILINRRKAEEALRQHSQIVSSSSDLLSMVDKNYVYKSANAAYLKTVGKSLDQVVGHTIAEIVGDDLFRTTIKPNADRCLGGEEVNYQAVLRFPAAGGRYMDATYYPYKDEKGDIQGFVVNARDITERKKEEQKLLESQYYLKKAQEIGKIGTWEMDVVKNILTWTNENYRIFGLPVGQPLTLEIFFSCIHPDDRDFVAEKWSAALNHEPYDIEHRVIANGMVKWVREKAEVAFDDKGNALKGIGFAQDITERKNAEMKLQQEMQTTQKYLDIAGVMLMALDSEGDVTLINRKGCEILEVSEKEALGLNWFENFLPVDVVDDVKDVFKKLMAGKTELVKHYQNPIRTKKGKECLIAFNNTILKDENDTITGILFSGEDITEAKKMEEQLRQSEKMQAIGQLAGGVAHDFNNQLAGIMSFTELIKNKAGGNGEVEFFADHILSIVGRSADLTRQLLAFSRKGKYRNENVDMHKLIVEVVSILKHSIDRRIEISQHLSASASTVKGDPSQLQNALLNLALNARDAMETGGKLQFFTKTVKQSEEGGKLPSDLAPGAYLRIEVRDNGKGMDSDIMKHVFEPFFTTKELGKGTGMGLAAVYGTIRHHQGVILADSTPGKGTVFSMYLPVVETAAEVSRKSGAKPAGPEKGGHIVFVDDEKFLRTSAQLILELAGFTVTLCADGGDVVELYKKMGSQIDLILMDMMMPGMCGNDAFRELKKLDPNVKVVFLSGYSMDDEARALLDQGALGFINKPFQEADLLGKVAEVLG